MRTNGLICLLTVVAFAAGCGHRERRVLENAEANPEVLAFRFLEALGRDDLEAMKRLRLTELEFCTHVFPELPASRLPNVKCDFVWSQATLSSMSGMTRMLEEHGKKRLAFVSIRFAGIEKHETYEVLQQPVVTVRDETGAISEARLFGSMLRMDGQVKLFGFVVD